MKCQVLLHARKNLYQSDTVGRGCINSLINWGNVQVPCPNQSYNNPK